MKKFFNLSIVVVILYSLMTNIVSAGKSDNPLLDREKEIHKSFVDAIPVNKFIDVNQFKKVYDEVMSGNKTAYLIDVRSHAEFYAFHIEGTDHIHAGHMYTIPKKIKDPNAEIYIFCRTSHRAKYVTGFLYKYGYKNVYCYKEGIVGWAKAKYPFVNQFTGKFNIIEYRKTPSKAEKSFRIREFHPY